MKIPISVTVEVESDMPIDKTAVLAQVMLWFGDKIGYPADLKEWPIETVGALRLRVESYGRLSDILEEEAYSS